MNSYIILGVRNAVTCAIAELCTQHRVPYSWATDQEGRNFQPTPGSAPQFSEVNPKMHVVTVGVDSFGTVPNLNHPGGETHLSTRMKPTDGTASAGYCQPPTKYWEASLLGQFFALGLTGEPTQVHRLSAAADYCITAAYAGQCPGINPEELSEFRMVRRIAELMTGEPHTLRAARDIARVWGATPTTADEWRKAIEMVHNHTRKIIEAAPKIWVPSDEIGKKVAISNLTFRDAPPELLEVSALNGLPVVTRKRVMIKRAPKENVALFGCGAGTSAGVQPVIEFMGGTVIPQLQSIYGDPYRGFAGGYR